MLLGRSVAEPPQASDKDRAKELAKIPPYKRMLQGEDAKRADRLSQLPRGTPREKPTALPSQQPRPYEHPYYWAAFILIGDPD